MEFIDRDFHLWRAREERRLASAAPDLAFRAMHARRAAEHEACARRATGAGHTVIVATKPSEEPDREMIAEVNTSAC